MSAAETQDSGKLHGKDRGMAVQVGDWVIWMDDGGIQMLNGHTANIIVLNRNTIDNLH